MYWQLTEIHSQASEEEDHQNDIVYHFWSSNIQVRISQTQEAILLIDKNEIFGNLFCCAFVIRQQSGFLSPLSSLFFEQSKLKEPQQLISLS